MPRPISNIPSPTELLLRVGSTMTLSGTVTSGGVAVDLTGSTIAGFLGETALTAVIDAGVGGTFTLTIDPDMIPDPTVTTWSLDWTDTLGAVTPIFQGDAIVR